MILMLPSSKGFFDLDDVYQYCGWLLTSKRPMLKGLGRALHYCVDNECFTRPFNPARYEKAVKKIRDRHGVDRCRFVTAPDVVADAVKTMRLAATWLDKIRSWGMPVALVAQDGLERLAIPWNDLDAIFIGGSTRWKLSYHAAKILQEAKERGIWTHVGRVNSVYRAARLLVTPDSVDGTGWIRRPEYAAQWITWKRTGEPRQPHLWPLT